MRRVLAGLVAALLFSTAAAEVAGGVKYHVAVTVPPGWHADTDSKPFPRVLLTSPQLAAFDRASAEPMKRAPDEVVCAFSRAVKKDPVGQSQAEINAGVRRNFDDLKAHTRGQRSQDVLLYSLIEHEGMLGIALVFVGLDADHYGYLYASSTFDTPLYQFKGDCIGSLSERSALKPDIVQIIASFRPIP